METAASNLPNNNQGTPALTVNQYGKGYAYYICADAEELFYHDFYAKI